MRPHKSFGNAFLYAGTGIWLGLTGERNFRVHLTVAMAVTVLGWLMRLMRWEWLGILLAFGLVLSLELVNTAIEAVVDLASPDLHALAKVAKDAGAGAVLVASLAAVGIGLSVFVPHLGKFGYDFMVRWRQSPTVMVLILVAYALANAALWGYIGRIGSERRRPEPFR